VERPYPHEHPRGDAKVKVGRIEPAPPGAKPDAARLRGRGFQRIQRPQAAELVADERLETRRRDGEAVERPFGGHAGKYTAG
jgi:hypothetical protein